MPKMTLKANNFSSGEISPRLVGLSDLDRYQTAALRLENMIPLLQGGAVRRPGLVHAGYPAAQVGAVRLVPFVAGREDAAVLVLTAGALRLFTAAGPVLGSDGQPLELVTPWGEADLVGLDWAQDAEVLYLVQGEHPPMRLRHAGVGVWTLAAVPFVTRPQEEIGHRFGGVQLLVPPAGVGDRVSLTASQGVFVAADAGRFVEGAGGRGRVYMVNAATSISVEVVEPFALPLLTDWRLADSPLATVTPSAKGLAGTLVSLTADVATWRAQDVGRWVEVDGGLVELMTVTSDTVAQGVIRKELPAAVAAPPLSWTLLGPVWSPETGYPRSVTLFEQRLVFGGTRTQPMSIWGSAIGAVLDFAPGTNDDDAWSFRMSSEQAQAVRYTVGGRVLSVLSGGAEFTVSGGTQAMTPTNVQVRAQTAYGTALVRPLRVGGEVLMVAAAGRKLRAFAYRLETDSFAAADLSVFSDHITAPSLVDMGWQQEPDALLWLVRADGVLLSVTFDRDQGVVAWARHLTAGRVRAVAVVPLGEGQPDRLWVAVERQGQLRVEWLDRLAREDAVRGDAGAEGSRAEPQALWPGLLAHLAPGTFVDVVGDDADLGSLPVGPGGDLTLPVPVQRVRAGLGYSGVLVPTVPELAGSGASGALSAVRSGRVLLRFLGGVGGMVDNERLPDPPTDTVTLDMPPPVQEWSGEMLRLGWSRGPRPLMIRQDRPMPFHVLAVIHAVGLNDG